MIKNQDVAITEADTRSRQEEEEEGLDRQGNVGKHYGTISSYLPQDFLLLLSSIEESEKYIITTITLSP